MEDIVIVGRHAVKEAIVSGHTINKIWIQEGIRKQQINDILKNAKAQKLIIQTVPKSKLDNLANAPHQGVAALIAPYEYADFDQFIQSQKEKKDLSTVIILDGLEDPHNLGAIMRSAECAGACGIIVSKHNSCGLTETVAKTSAGAIEYMPCVQVTNIAKTIDELKKDGFWIAACDMNGSVYTEADMRGKLAIVIGNEGKGIRQLVKSKCDFVVSIPLLGQINSLNASNAAAIIMYEALRQRSEKR